MVVFLAILRETMDSLYLPSSGFSSALQEAANDMIKYMRLVFPLVAKHQMMVLAQHGFTAQGEGEFQPSTHFS